MKNNIVTKINSNKKVYIITILYMIICTYDYVRVIFYSLKFHFS